MGKSKGNRAKRGDVAAPPSSPPGRRSDEGLAFSPVLVPCLSGPSFEVAVVGSASGAAANGPARIYLSPTLMMAEAIGTGDLLAVAVLRSDEQPTSLTALNLQSNGSSSNHHGEYYTLAETWPSPKLPRDATRLSGPLSESLFNPRGGSLLRIYPLERNQTRPTTPQEGAKQQNSPSKATTSTQATSRAIAQIRPCSHLELQWCPPIESVHTGALPLPVSPLTPPNRTSTPRHSTPDRSRTTNSPLQPPPSPRTPNPQTARGRRLSQASPSTPEGHRNTPRGVPASPSLSPLKREEEICPPPEMTEGQRAAVSALLAEGKRKKVIETFAARWLAGRYLIEGNFVSISLCGFNCTFQVLRPTSSDETAPSVTQDSEPTFSFQPLPQARAPTTPEPPLVAFSVVGSTSVSLLEPAQSEPSNIHAQSFEQEGVEESGTADGGATLETEKVGYSELGGVGDQIKALKELVELPLRRPEMFRR